MMVLVEIIELTTNVCSFDTGNVTRRPIARRRGINSSRPDAEIRSEGQRPSHMCIHGPDIEQSKEIKLAFNCPKQRSKAQMFLPENI